MKKKIVKYHCAYVPTIKGQGRLKYLSRTTSNTLIYTNYSAALFEK